MTLPAKSKNNVPSSDAQEPQDRESGWDPFEVWRTRVLLPRLAESKAGPAATPSPQVKLVRP